MKTREPEANFGPNRDENGMLRTLHSEERHSLYRSSYIVTMIKSRRLRLEGHISRMKEGRSVFPFLTDKPTGNRPIESPRRRREKHIRIDLKEIGVNTRNWVDSRSG